jgi:nitrogen fixation/metabolism regulation signal transduction histidine kinase
MRGVARSGTGDRRSSMVASPYRLPSARDADEAASSAARRVRDVVGPQTAIHVLMPDASAGSRIVWGGSERVQVRPYVTAKRRGSGLRLFITRRLVDAHRGKVWVDQGHPGAIFQMLLPVERKELQRFAS